jgi:hypothetical protein
MHNVATSLSCICELYYMFTAKASLFLGRLVLCQSSRAPTSVQRQPELNTSQLKQELVFINKIGYDIS